MHKGKSHPGEHAAIVPQAMWEAAHALLAINPKTRANTQGWLWSIPVSGQAEGADRFLAERQGPYWLTGGAFGLDASAVALLAATLAGLVITIVVLRRGHWVPVGWLPCRR